MEIIKSMILFTPWNSEISMNTASMINTRRTSIVHIQWDKDAIKTTGIKMVVKEVTTAGVATIMAVKKKNVCGFYEG